LGDGVEFLVTTLLLSAIDLLDILLQTLSLLRGNSFDLHCGLRSTRQFRNR
jgi:hypothetical protein